MPSSIQVPIEVGIAMRTRGVEVELCEFAYANTVVVWEN